MSLEGFWLMIALEVLSPGIDLDDFSAIYGILMGDCLCPVGHVNIKLPS